MHHKGGDGESDSQMVQALAVRKRVHGCERPEPSENQAKRVVGPCQHVGQFSFYYHVIAVGDGH